MEDFLKTHFVNYDLKFEKLEGDGGHRSYTRLHTKNKDSYILMSSGKGDQSLKDFVSIQEKLITATCLVPKIFKKDFSKGLLLLQDLGKETLEEIQNKQGLKFSKKYYLKAITQLINLQQIKDSNITFDKKFFLEEVDLAVDRLEEFLKIKLKKESRLKTEDLSRPLKEEMEKIISEFIKAPMVYCHRDFHSKNMMILREDVYLLDFQDAGIGPLMYDLTSLIYDSYVTFTDPQRLELIKFYYENLPPDLQKSISSLSNLQFFIQLQFLQRGLKACGCFAGFYNNNQKTRHLQYIKPSLQTLYEVARGLNYKNTASYFKKLDQELNQIF